jgi:hypothetical protein
MSKFKYVLLAIAIAIVFVFFVGFGIASFYKSPQYEDFCRERGKFFDEVTEQKCSEIGGKWNAAEIARPLAKIDNDQLLCTKTSEIDDAVTLNCQTQEQLDNQGYCDWDFYCREEFDNARELYNRNVFIVATGIGILVLIIGFALKMASVSAGLMSGGVLTLLYGVMRYWTDLPDYGRFIILGITLGILIWLGYKRVRK